MRPKYPCPRCSSTNRLDEHPDGKGFVRGSCLRCGEGWIRRADWGMPTTLRATVTPVEGQSVDEGVTLTYSPPQEEELERREPPVLTGKGYFTPEGLVWVSDVQKDRDVIPEGAYAVVGGYLAVQHPEGPSWFRNPGELPVPVAEPVQTLRGRSYFTRMGIIHTIDVDGPPPPGSYAFQERTGTTHDDGTVTWDNEGPVVGIQQPPEKPTPDPGCGQCVQQAESIKHDDDGFVHWRCVQCGRSWKVRDNLPRPVEERAALSGGVLYLPDNLTWKTAAGVPASDVELDAALKVAFTAAEDADWTIAIRRYHRQRAALIVGTCWLIALAFVLAVLAIWSPFVELELALTSLLAALTSIGLTRYTTKHHHKPVRS